MINSADFIYVDTTEDLIRNLDKFDPFSPLFLDCEFQSERHYFPKPCLIQVADRETILLIDPLSDISLDPLIELLKTSDQPKVVHAADQDLLIFYRLGAGWLSPIFDTQLAGAFLGYGSSIAYSELVSRICKRRIPKQSQATNWQRRPLSDDQLSYAASDVNYLRQIYDTLSLRLKEKQRSKWVAEIWQERFSSIKNFVDPNYSWQRLKLKSRHRRSLLLIKALAAWREKHAQRMNVPRNQIISEHALLELCDVRPSSRSDCQRMRFFPTNLLSAQPAIVSMFQDLLDTIQKGCVSHDEAEEDSTVQETTNKELGSRDQARVDLLRLLLRDNARRHEVAAKYIAKESELHAFITNDAAAKRFKVGWRGEVFGNDASRVVAGDLAAAVGEKGLEWLVPTGKKSFEV